MATPFDEDDRFIRDGRSLARWLPLLIEQERAARRAAENAISAMYWGAPVADVTALSNGAPDLNAHHRALAAAVSAALVDPAWDGQRYLRDLVATLHADEARDERLRALESCLDDLTFGLVLDNVNDEEVSEDAAAHGVDRGPPPDLADVPALQAES